MYQDSRLEDIIADAERGTFPPADLGVTVVGQPSPRDVAVLAFTGHSVVAADVEPDWVMARLPPADLSAPLCPPFLSALSERLGREVNNVDMVCLADALPASAADVAGVHLRELGESDHPRVARSRRFRDGVRVWATEGGIVTVGCGVAGRREVTVEVGASHRGRGLGHALAFAARGLVPPERPLWAQIAPGNAASVRAFLRAGYRPVGAEALLVPPDAAN